MNKHALVQSGMGLGLVAASLGANAQNLHTFDQAMMFMSPVTGGTKFITFVPSMLGRTATAASPSVLMLEMFTPTSGTTNSWGFVFNAGAVVASDGGGSSNSASFQNSANVSSVYGAGRLFYLGDFAGVQRSFSETKSGLSSAVCSLQFTASIDTAGDLRFIANGSAWNATNSAPGVVSITFSTAAGATTSSTYGQALFNQSLSASIPTNAFSAYAVSGLETSATGTAATAYISNRNKCVPVYTGRVNTFGTDLAGNPLPYSRLY